MTEYSVIINEAEIINNNLRIEIAVVCNGVHHPPKMRVVFKNGTDIRRLPLLMKNVFYQPDNDSNIVYYSYEYDIINLFSCEKAPDMISVYFEITTDDNCAEEIPFYISRGIANNNKIRIDDRYIGGELFNGIASYKPNLSNNNGDTCYLLNADPENKRLELQLKKQKKDKVSGSKFNASKSFANAIVLVLVLFSILLLIPLFLINSLLSTIGVIPQRNAPQTNGFKSKFAGQLKAEIASYILFAIKDEGRARKIIAYKDNYLTWYYSRLCKKPVVKNRISFISGRRDEMGGNEKFVYDILKSRNDIDFKFILQSDLDKSSKIGKKKEFYKLYATSRIVIVDDYFNLLDTVKKRNDVTLIQLWHACGAFKTFGFSRLGKPGGPKQTSTSHRMYDYTIVSSENIIKYYAEGFGLSDRNILPTGIPRTDIFRDSEYADRIKKEFYSKHPQLTNKKIIMFAPTFRGAGQNSAYYPLDVFDPDRFYEKIGDEYAVIIKLHPFCKERFKIEDKYKDYIIDLSDEDELNDLLFVTDLLITDYSSAIFEASLLDIPMLFFSYDLYHYISDRDFYCDYETFVPGKIVFTQQALEEAVIKSDCETEKIKPFREKFFSGYDGKSSERVANFIIDILEGRNE